MMVNDKAKVVERYSQSGLFVEGLVMSKVYGEREWFKGCLEKLGVQLKDRPIQAQKIETAKKCLELWH